MSSAAMDRPVANMNTTMRTARFGDYPLPASRTNIDEKPSPGAAAFNSYAGGPWQNNAQGIWGSTRTTGYTGKRDQPYPTAEEDSALKAVSSLTATSEADEPWPVQPTGPWNETSPSSASKSGGTSPVRYRSTNMATTNTVAPADSQNTSPYLARQTASSNLAGRSQVRSTLDPSSGTFSFAQSNGQAFGLNSQADMSNFRRGSAANIEMVLPRYESRGSFSGFVNTQLPPSRDPSLPPSRHSENAPNSATGYWPAMPANYGQNQNSIVHRPSIGGKLSSYHMAQNTFSNDLGHSVDPSMASISVNGKTPNNQYSISPTSGTLLTQDWKPAQNIPRGQQYAPDAYNTTDQYSDAMPQLGAVSKERTLASMGYDDHVNFTSHSSKPSISTPDNVQRYGPRQICGSQHDHSKQPFQQQYFQPSLYNHQHSEHPYLPQYSARLPSQQSFRGHDQYGYHYATTHFHPGMIPHREPTRGHQDLGHGLRSPLLEEFRSNTKSSKNYELKDIYGHIVEFSGDQHGSRFIQQKLEGANSDEKDQIFREIQTNALQLMTDVFGNYVIQKMFEHGNQVQKRVLADSMRSHVNELSIQMYGCRVVQKALEHVLDDQQIELVKELQQDVLRCVKDQNGNHVVQKAIERVPVEHVQFILDAFRGQVHALAVHNYGCRVIQRMLEHCGRDDQAFLLEELFTCADMLITDQFGNYVIQHIIQFGKQEDKDRVIEMVNSQLLTLCKHKFASNVVEKAILFCTEQQRQTIVAHMITPNADGSSPLQLLMKDQYGNYVVQKLLLQLGGTERAQLVESIKPQMTQLRKYNYGKQIAAIERLVFTDSAVASQPSKCSSIEESQSLVPTPLLTSSHGSPQSSNAPSTSNSVPEGSNTTILDIKNLSMYNT